MRLPQALITDLIPEEFLWGVDSTGFSLTIMWHFFTFRDIIYFEFFRGRPLVTRKNSNYFITNSTWMFSKMDNSPSPDSEKLTFWCPRPSFFEFWFFFAHTTLHLRKIYFTEWGKSFEGYLTYLELGLWPFGNQCHFFTHICT